MSGGEGLEIGGRSEASADHLAAPDSVLLVTPRWGRDGGVASHVMSSASLLADRGVDVSVLATHIDAEAAPGVTLMQGERLDDVGASPGERLGSAMDCDPAVVHVHQMDDPDLVGELRMHAPVLVSVHGYSACTSGVHYFKPGEECTRAHGPGCVPNLAFRGCAHTRQVRLLPGTYKRVSRGVQALRAADLAVSYSTAIDAHLATNGISRRTIVPYFPTTPPAAAPAAGQPRRVLFAGRVVAPKGVAVLIRAARTVDAEFVVCGDGWRLEEMRRLARRLRVDDRVHFEGWVSADTLADELAEATVVAMPSVWPEPFGLVGIEAGAAAKPAIASSTGGIGDWLEHGVNGLLVEPGDAHGLADALNELLGDPERRKRMGAAGRRIVSE
ncbi:MAG TPA: glycosyltransferase family 4 protein, partial [Solirubrobacteraceae bacterium]|nr:glycosyltransferase family 4 protein [Solirubrobacteraceae bacterium]